MVDIPRWKKILSYFHEFHIESASSEHNPHLYVCLKQGRYQLCTANAIYSYGDLYNNFSAAFNRIRLDQLNIKKVLILGFGLGSIPIILEQIFKKKYHYTAVEIDEAVLYLAQKYAMPSITAPIEFVCADAHAYVMQCQQQFDMIAMDVFLDDLVPSAFETDQFLQQIQTLLNPDGVLLYNRLAHSADDIKNAKAFYQNSFQANFKNASYLEVDGNWMLLNRKDIIK